MRVFAENPNSVLDEFSKEFERGYLETLNQLHGTKRVKANKVYQEYIQDKHHIHMNATIWTTLTGFCMHLGKESKAIVDETEKGWFIQYIDRDPKVLARQAQNEQRQRFELDEEERRKREILAQVQAAEERKRGENGEEEEDEEVDNTLNRENNDQKIAVTLGAPATSLSVGLKKRPRAVLGFAESDDEDEGAPQTKKNDAGSAHSQVGSDKSGEPASVSGIIAEAGIGGGITSASLVGRVVTSAGRVVPMGSSAGGGVLAQMMLEEERRKAKQVGQQLSSQPSSQPQSVSKTSVESVSTTRKAPAAEKEPMKSTHGSWLYKNIVVKVVNKEVARGRIYKLKGRVVRLLGRDYEEAEVEIEGEVYTLHYKDLETTLPKVGRLYFPPLYIYHLLIDFNTLFQLYNRFTIFLLIARAGGSSAIGASGARQGPRRRAAAHSRRQIQLRRAHHAARQFPHGGGAAWNGVRSCV